MRHGSSSCWVSQAGGTGRPCGSQGNERTQRRWILLGCERSYEEEKGGVLDHKNLTWRAPSRLHCPSFRASAIVTRCISEYGRGRLCVFYPLIMLSTLAGERPDLQFGPTEGMPSFLQRPCQVVLRVDRIEIESRIFLSRWT